MKRRRRLSSATPSFATDEASVIAALAQVDPTLVPPVLGAAPGRVLLDHIPGEDCWDASAEIIASGIDRFVAAQAALDPGRARPDHIPPGHLPPGLPDRRAPAKAVPEKLLSILQSNAATV